MKPILLIALFCSATGFIFGQRIEHIAKIRETPELFIPEAARNSGLSGRMSVWVSVDPDGNVSNVRSVSGPYPICQSVTREDVLELRNAAVEAAKLAKFEPVIKDGRRRAADGIVEFEVRADDRERTDDPGVVDKGLLSREEPDGSGNFLRRSIVGNMPKPPYPAAAKVVRAAGPVSVRLLIDENGSVFSAEAISGHPLLRASATQAACRTQFRPTVVSDQRVRITGVIIYNFVP